MNILTGACDEIDRLLGPDKRGFHWVEFKKKTGFARFRYRIERPPSRPADGSCEHEGHRDPTLEAIAEARLRAEDATALACMVCGAAVERASASGPMCARHLATRYENDTASLEAAWYGTDDQTVGAQGEPLRLTAAALPIGSPPQREPALRVFPDDLRSAPDGWLHVFWPEEAIAILETNNVATISLDHDLGDDARGTGYDVLLWIEEAVALRGFHPPQMLVHSANPPARERMLARIRAIERRTQDP